MPSTVELDHRVSNLEAILAHFLESTENSLNLLSREMREFKEEMREFKEEMRKFKEEMQDFKKEMQDFKEEMRDYKMYNNQRIEEMRMESQNTIRQMNKQWGDLANRMGTLIEDLIFPATRPLLKRYFQIDPDTMSIRVRRKNRSLQMQAEIDVLAMGEGKIFIIEVRSHPTEEYLSKLLEKTQKTIPLLFPEYTTLSPVPILASIHFEDHFISHATKAGIYLMAYREYDYMDILNFPELNPDKIIPPIEDNP